MTTVQFAQAIWTWLLADPAHVVVAFAAIAAFTPTPAPGTFLSKVYRVVDVFALNFLHAKSTGVAAPTVDLLAKQVAAMLEQKLAANATPSQTVTKE